MIESQSTISSPSAGYKNEPYIHTQDGRFYADNPTWSIKAMAHALAQTARYRGHADKFYSVAEHSVLVAQLMQHLGLGDPREGLLHDATESVLPDVSAPFKQFFPDLKSFDKRLDADLRRKFLLPTTKTDGCTKADWLALFIEASQILPERGEDFEDPYNFRPVAKQLRKDGWQIYCFPWERAKRVFLGAYQQLWHEKVV